MRQSLPARPRQLPSSALQIKRRARREGNVVSSGLWLGWCQTRSFGATPNDEAGKMITTPKPRRARRARRLICSAGLLWVGDEGKLAGRGQHELFDPGQGFLELGKRRSEGE